MAIHGRRREAVGDDEDSVVVPRHEGVVSRRVEPAAEVGAAQVGRTVGGAAVHEDGRLRREGGSEAGGVEGRVNGVARSGMGVLEREDVP